MARHCSRVWSDSLSSSLFNNTSTSSRMTFQLPVRARGLVLLILFDYWDTWRTAFCCGKTVTLISGSREDRWGASLGRSISGVSSSKVQFTESEVHYIFMLFLWLITLAHCCATDPELIFCFIQGLTYIFWKAQDLCIDRRSYFVLRWLTQSSFSGFISFTIMFKPSKCTFSPFT